MILYFRKVLHMKYSVQMIEKSLLEDYYFDIREIYKMIIFDILIGNSDRHHSNWAIKHKSKKSSGHLVKTTPDLCPLYDNGSSLCSYEDNNNLVIFFKDKIKFEALVNTKSKSAIGWENERPIRHFELLKKLKNNFYELTVEYIEKIKNNINAENIDKIEAKNSELKSRFGYNTANACGKIGITIQGASVLFLANIKRIIKLKEEKIQNNG